MRSSLWKKGIQALIIMSLLLLTACGTKEKSGNGSKNPEDLKDKVYNIKVGYSETGGAPLLDIATQEGYFKEEGVNVERVGFKNSTDGLNALQAGKIDVGLSFGTAGPLTFIANGSDFRIIGGHLEGGHPILVKKEDKDQYKTLEDFKGKKVGTIRIFTSDIVFRSALAEAGIDWEKDLNIVEFKTGGDLIQALSSGKVDAAVSANSYYAQAVESSLVPVTWSNDLQPGHVCCRVVTREKLLKKDNGEGYKRFLKALIRAERAKKEDPEVAIKAARQYFKGVDDKVIDSIVNEKHSNYSADPNKKSVIKMWNQMQKIGYIKNTKDLDVNEYINIELYEKALKELMKENPTDTYYKKLLKEFVLQDE